MPDNDTEKKQLSLPLSRKAAADLRAGDACLLTGPLFVLRDAGHTRLLEEMQENEEDSHTPLFVEPNACEALSQKSSTALPYNLEGQLIFYAGPSPAAAGLPFGSIGPTTAGRMDFATPTLLKAGVAGTIGKGRRSKEVVKACKETSSVYFLATGGVAALLASCVTSSEVIAYSDLGTEALRRITVKDFPVFVGIDTQGHDLYDTLRR